MMVIAKAIPQRRWPACDKKPNDISEETNRFHACAGVGFRDARAEGPKS
jgi:hypothetical protein